MMRAFTIVAAIVLALAVPMIADHDHGSATAAKLSEMDAKLQQLVDRMNALQGAAKVDAMAAVLTELTAQRTIMRTMMASQAGMHDCCGGGSCDMMHGKESAAHH